MEKEADICMICEGSYPYYSGGVAQWVHEIIQGLPEKTFHVLTLVPPHPELVLRYEFPKNVVGHSVLIVQDLPRGAFEFRAPKNMWEEIGPVIKGMISSKTFKEFDAVLSFFTKYHARLGKGMLCESKDFWNFVLKLYHEMISSGPFKAYFATIYTLALSFFSVIYFKLPKAKIFHSVCTGYAGFLLHRAKKEKGAPCILTEHGIYSNERRIEISMADWIVEMGSLDLALEDKKRTLKDFWLNAFYSFAHACYYHCDEVISTFDGNQEIQMEGGADPKKIQTIVHGIKQENSHFIKRDLSKHTPTVAFIGRIVPIKDVKSFIRACKIVKNQLPAVRLYAIGPTEEDPVYFEECRKLAALLGLEQDLIFTGKVKLQEYFPKIDLMVLTSISEAQPLVILEGGATGIPVVATNVGACEQLLYGSKDETPPLGKGGIVTPLVNPEETAKAIIHLLSDQQFYESCSETIAKRIEKYYRFEEEIKKYGTIYDKYSSQI